jgi:type IV pilus assembly protein PilM
MTDPTMARRSKTIVGLDIEPGSIAAVQVATADGLAVERAAVVGLDPHVMRDGEVADGEALTEALRALWAQNPWLDKKVRIGVANARIVMRVMDLPPLEDPKDMATAVQFQAKDELPMALDQAVIDFQSIGIVDTPNGRRARVVLVAARRDMIERVLNATRAAGLKPEGIDLAAFAMVRALGDAGPALYVSVGGLTNLAVAEDGNCLFTRVSGGGLESMAVDLAERQGLTLDHARAWLRHVGLEQDLDELEGDAAIIAEARNVLVDGARRVAADVRASLDFHHTQNASGPVVERVLLTGPAVAVPGFPEVLERELGLPVESRVMPGAPEGPIERLSIAAGLAVEAVTA